MKEQELMKFLSECNAVQFQEAMTRPEYSDLMKKGLKGLLIDGYMKAAAKTTFQELVVMDSSDSDKENYPSMGIPAMPRLVKEGEEYKGLNSGPSDNVEVTNFKYGGIIGLTNEANADDKSPGKQLAKQAKELGPNHAKFKDKTFWNIVTTNGAIYDGNNLFSLNHPGVTGGAALANNDNIYTNVTMSANALAVAIGMMALWEGATDEQDLDIAPTKVFCSKRLLPTATGLLTAQNIPLVYAAGGLGPAAAAGQMPNALAPMGLKPIASHRLDIAAVLDWYLWTDFPGLLYQPREGLTVVEEATNSGEGFKRGVNQWRSSERFGGKPINWRCGLKVS